MNNRFHSVASRMAPCPEYASSAVLILAGFSAVIGQIVLMREMMVVFSGNEISLGIMLATWLFWTAAGSILCGTIIQREINARRTIAVLECLLGISLPFAVWALRASKSLFQTVPGELVGPVPVLLASLLCLSVFCVVAGALFVAATRMYGHERAVSSRAATSSAYLLEAAGSALGGVVSSFVLLHYLEPFQIACVVLVLNLTMAIVLLFRLGRKQIGFAAVAAALFAVFLLAEVAPWLEQSAQQRQWRGFHLLASRDSIYGNITVVETGNIRSLYENGLILANSPDESAAEEAVHYALLEHPAPRHILMIGGGAGGAVAQARRHPSVERIDLVELDPALIGMARQYYPSESALLFSDPRVHLHYADGRYYLKSTRDTFDVIIVNVPDPQTAQLNRFYTAEFFRSARNHLTQGGMLALGLRSSEEAISPDLAEFLRCINRTLREVFPYVVALPGETIHFFAATRPDVLTDNPHVLVARLLERNLKTRYVREYFIPYRMMPDRMAQVRDSLQPLATTQVNRDFSPIAYYFDVVLWSAQFKPAYAGWLRAAAQVNFTTILGASLIVLLMIAALLALVPVRGQRARAAAGCCMAATGFTQMALQIFLLLSFQSIYGFIFHQLAILIALCMAGIAFGGWLGMRRIRGGNNPPCRAVASTQVLLALSAPVLMLLVSLLAKLSGMAASWLAAQCVFPAMAALCGLLGGYQFPLVTEMYFPKADGRRRLGMLYAIDLLGGSLGALLLSGYLIPVFGFWKTAWLCAAVNLAPALLAARTSLEAQPMRS
ncbi:MAG: fused MFS/spermidine synthase [Terracidiphilus sp.]|jgi:spermidine synthase